MKKQIRIGRRRANRMLCAVCRDAEKLSEAWQENDSDTVYLSCGHTRTPYLLPSAQGAVSLEDIVNNTPEAARLFPFVINGVNVTEILAEQKEREEWNQ
ncbi:MAG: hypothetical protein WCA10_10215 [Terracidiphilus sp.]